MNVQKNEKARYINADKIDIESEIDEIPAADVVEVVRCKNCSSSEYVGDVLYCSYFNKNVEKDGFCSEGG